MPLLLGALTMQAWISSAVPPQSTPPPSGTPKHVPPSGADGFESTLRWPASTGCRVIVAVWPDPQAPITVIISRLASNARFLLKLNTFLFSRQLYSQNP
jgi:hypothetical protein